MPFQSAGTYACAKLQQSLIDYYGNNSAELKTMGSTALIRFLLSPQNTRNFRQITDGIQAPIPGKKRGVAFLVDEPFCYDVCAISDVTCTTTRTESFPASKEQVFDLSGPAYRPCDAEGAPLRLKFAESDLMKYCSESDTSYITRQIARFNRKFIESLDRRLVTALSTSVGKNADGDSVTNIPFFITQVNGVQALNPEAVWFLTQTYNDIGGDGQFGLVGGKILNKLMSFQKWAGLNDAGIDLSKVDDMNPYTYYDRNVDSVVGINNFFMLSPGAAQLVYWNEHKGEKRRVVTDLYTHSTFIDIATGVEVDFEWYYDYKCKSWTYEPYIYAELAVAPPGGCGIEDSNGVILVNDCSNGATAPDCGSTSNG